MASRSSTPKTARGDERSPRSCSPYATPSATREVLERHGLYAKYALGQNFLVNDDVVRKILELSAVDERDHVLEVGPGIGTLTSALLQRAGHVTSIEMDHDLPAVLRDTLAPWLGRFTLLEMDARDLDEEKLALAAKAAGSSAGLCRANEKGVPSSSCGNARDEEAVGFDPGAAPLPGKLVSNLPYAVAATIVLDYLQRFDCLRSATVMVQREVAERMMAQPGSKVYGAYTVKLSLYAQPAGRFAVAPGNFFPPPHVESVVIRLDRHIPRDEQGAPLPIELQKAACTMADAAFATRRKTLANSCKTYFSGNPVLQEALPLVFEGAGIDPRRRGETLALDEFVALGRSLMQVAGQAALRDKGVRG